MRNCLSLAISRLYRILDLLLQLLLVGNWWWCQKRCEEKLSGGWSEIAGDRRTLIIGIFFSLFLLFSSSFPLKLLSLYIHMYRNSSSLFKENKILYILIVQTCENLFCWSCVTTGVQCLRASWDIMSYVNVIYILVIHVLYIFNIESYIIYEWYTWCFILKQKVIWQTEHSPSGHLHCTTRFIYNWSIVQPLDWLISQSISCLIR